MKYNYEERIAVLDHGYVYVVDRMGDDLSIERSARVSYQKATRHIRTTRGLLRYLMRHRHTTPYESCVITLGMRIPIFVARQLVRHRMQSINEESARYSVVRDEFYIPDSINLQSNNNKQGRGDALPEEEADEVREMMRRAVTESYDLYEGLIKKGVARELSRIILPLTTYTEWHTTMNVHNLLHLLALRMDPHAQLETRLFANAIAEIVKEWLPLTWEAFEDYRLYAKGFSRMEMELLKKLIDIDALRSLLASDQTMERREHSEFLEKLC
jgi:thymidylate synthase (FAD)